MVKNDRGSVRWHRNGWEIRVQQDGKRVTRRVKAPNTRAGRRTAEEALDQLATEVGLGHEGMTVAQALARYELTKGPAWSPSTRRSHPNHAGPLVEAFGDVEISKLTHMHIEEVYGGWIDDGLAPGTVRRRNAVLSAALIQAERWGAILVAPTRKVELVAQAPAATEGLPEASVVLAAIGRLPHARLKVVARLAVATGARRGELLALRWCDVDLDAGTLRIAGAVAVGPDGTLHRKGTKKGERRRAMRIDPGTVAMLRAWRTTTATEAMALGVGRPAADAPIVPSPVDPSACWSPDRITMTWIRHRKAVGLALRFHDLRHLHATALLAAGVPASTVADRLGHGVESTTTDFYSHAMPAGDEAAADVIARAAGDS